MGRLLQIIGLFCRISSFYRALLQKIPIISRSLLIVATPYKLKPINQRADSTTERIRPQNGYQLGSLMGNSFGKSARSTFRVTFLGLYRTGIDLVPTWGISFLEKARAAPLESRFLDSTERVSTVRISTPDPHVSTAQPDHTLLKPTHQTNLKIVHKMY